MDRRRWVVVGVVLLVVVGAVVIAGRVRTRVVESRELGLREVVAPAALVGEGGEWYEVCPGAPECNAITGTVQPTYTPRPTPTCRATPTCPPMPTLYPTATPYPPQPTFGPPPQVPAAVVAFPGAEGFGAYSMGGRGGQVIKVTNLNDSGPGSLRAAVEAEGPRIVIFRTGGTIELQSALKIRNPFITIAGQTAPGGGITVKRASGGIGIWVQTHDVVIRYVRSRPGPGGQSQALLIADNGSDQIHSIVIDHCSFSWATDEVVTTWYAARDITIQWSIISEGLDCSTHPKGCHAMGALLGGYKDDEAGSGSGAYNISFHHNLIAHQGERSPVIKAGGLVDVVNNVAYNPRWTFSYVDAASPSVIPVNYVANYFKRGPDSVVGKYEIKVVDRGSGGTGIYVQGNIGPHRTTNDLPGDVCVDPDSRSYVVADRHDAPFVSTTSALEAYDQVLAGAGATIGLDGQGNSYWRRDAVDERIVNDVRNGTGRIIDDPSQVGGWPELAAGTPPADSDHDGMPDEWEVLCGFNPNDPSDGPEDADGDGYTNVEEYLNGTEPDDYLLSHLHQKDS